MSLISTLLLLLSLSFEVPSFSCIRYFLHNSHLALHSDRQTVKKSVFLDYKLIADLDTKPIDSLRLKTEGSFLFENNAKIVISDKFKAEIAKNQVMCASARFSDELNTTGWNKLYVKTYKECPVLMQMFAAGVLEGALTSQQILDFHTNVNSDHADKNSMQDLKDFFEKLDFLIDGRIKNMSFFAELNETLLNYWSQIALSKAQLYGVYKGFNGKSPQKLTLTDFYFLNVDGQISELLEFMEFKRKFQSGKETIQTQILSREKNKGIDVKSLLAKSQVESLKEFWVTKILRRSHCSVFVKPLRNNQTQVYENILASHSTWDDYNAMIRIFKHYDFELEQPNDYDYKFLLMNHNVTFSSYPGCISSTDDFYLINDKLMVTETTLGILDSDSYSRILPTEDYVPDFLRILLANRLSNSAKEWIQWFMLKNTGTYNSQWTLIDLPKFKQSLNQTSLRKETIFVLEQFPGKYHYEDVTHYVEKNKYWASYNVPFFSSTRRESGYTQLEADEPAAFSYLNNARGKIFESKNSGINTVEDLKHLMLFNPWKKQDSTGENNQITAEAIGSRYDLLDGWNDNFGEIDAKVCDFDMMLRHECFAISGPSHQDLPVFKWSTARKQNVHQGLIDEWNFDWIKIDPAIIRSDK